MDNFSSVINYILNSNVINFIIMLWILGVIVKKLNLGKVFDKSVEDVALEIKKSDDEIVRTRKLRDNAQEVLDNLPHDIEAIEKTSKEKTNAFKLSIEENTQRNIFNLDESVKKAIAIEEKKISNLLTEKTSKDSIELAKKHIEHLFETNPELHTKYILESLDELDKVKL